MLERMWKRARPGSIAAAARAIFVTGCALTACGGNVEVSSGSSGTAGSGDGGVQSSSSTGGVGAGGSTATGGFGGDITTNPPGPCTSAKDCNAGEYCDDYSNGCFASNMGACSPVTPCAGVGPVCGCNGTIYSSDCEAFLAGVDLSVSACSAPADGFFCGALVCEVGAQSCVHYQGFATYDACEPYPAACDPKQGGTPSCACVLPYPGCMCSQDMAGNYVLICATAD